MPTAPADTGQRPGGGSLPEAGTLFACAAVLVAGVAQLSGEAATNVLGLCFFLLGLAHGAGVEDETGLRRIGALQALAYLASGAAVAGLFLFNPLAGLVLFLALSAWHFAVSECGMAKLSRRAVALLAVGGSAFFRPNDTAAIFALVTGGPVPSAVMTILSATGTAGAVLAVCATARGSTGYGHALMAFAATLVFAPVLAVGLVFLLAHALPVQLRQIAAYGSTAVWRAVALPTSVAVVGAAGLAAMVAYGWIGLPLAAAIAFGMATPHMLTDRIDR